MNIPESLNTLKVEAPEPHLWIVRFNRPEVLNAFQRAGWAQADPLSWRSRIAIAQISPRSGR